LLEKNKETKREEAEKEDQDDDDKDEDKDQKKMFIKLFLFAFEREQKEIITFLLEKLNETKIQITIDEICDCFEYDLEFAPNSLKALQLVMEGGLTGNFVYCLDFFMRRLEKVDDHELKNFVKFSIEKMSLDVNSTDNDGNTLLHFACKFNSLELLKYIIEEKSLDVHATNEKKRTLLHSVVSRYFKPSFELVKYLIEKWPEMVEAVDQDGNTPLHLIYNYSEEAVPIAKYLIEKNASLLLVKSNRKQIPFECMFSHRYNELFWFLLEETVK